LSAAMIKDHTSMKPRREPGLSLKTDRGQITSITDKRSAIVAAPLRKTRNKNRAGAVSAHSLSKSDVGKSFLSIVYLSSDKRFEGHLTLLVILQAKTIRASEASTQQITCQHRRALR
jgi:hypothetical protein